MTAESVIQRGEAIPSSLEYFSDSVFSTGMILMSAGVLLMIVFSLTQIRIKNKRTRSIALVSALAVLALGTIGSLILNHTNSEQQADTYVDAFHAWVVDDVTAYAETQDYIDRELVSIEYLKDSEDRNVPIVKFTGDSGVTETLEQPTAFNTAVKLVYDVKPGEPEFVRFYEIEHDLGHGFKPGTYGLTVHLHEQK